MFRRGYGGPQADCFDERKLKRINRELKENNFVPWMFFEPNEREGKEIVGEDNERGKLWAI